MKLFKYCGPGGVGILESRSIWLSQPKYLNDPFELNPSTTFREPDRLFVLKRIRDEYIASFKNIGAPFKAFQPLAADTTLKVAAPLKEERQHILMEELNEKFVLLCLTETNDNLPMWSHYAEHHKGFVIQFDEKHDFFKFCRKVNYSDTRPWVGLDDGKKDEGQEIVYTKSTHWAYENEYRLVRMAREGKKVMTPGQHPAFAFDLPPACIVSVALGCRASDELRKKIEGFLAAPGFSHVEIQGSKIHPDDFKLDINSTHKRK